MTARHRIYMRAVDHLGDHPGRHLHDPQAPRTGSPSAQSGAMTGRAPARRRQTNRSTCTPPLRAAQAAQRRPRLRADRRAIAGRGRAARDRAYRRSPSVADRGHRAARRPDLVNIPSRRRSCASGTPRLAELLTPGGRPAHCRLRVHKGQGWPPAAANPCASACGAAEGSGLCRPDPYGVAFLALRLWPAGRLAQGRGCAALTLRFGLRLANFSRAARLRSLGKLCARASARSRPSCRPTTPVPEGN